MNNYAEQIKQSITMQQAVENYGLEVNKRGFITCPFHGTDKTPSLRIYPENRGFYCFACGKGGDVVKFIQHYFNIDFKAAIVRLNYDFHLGLPIGERQTARQRAKARSKAKEQVQRRKAVQEAKEDRINRNWALWDEWIRLDINSRKYAPNIPDEELHPLFVEACHMLDFQSYLIDLHT